MEPAGLDIPQPFIKLLIPSALRTAFQQLGTQERQSSVLPAAPRRAGLGRAGQEFPGWQGSPGVPYLALSGADVVERHGAVPGAHGDAVAALVVTHHVEPEGSRETKVRRGKPGDIELTWNSTHN